MAAVHTARNVGLGGRGGGATLLQGEVLENTEGVKDRQSRRR